MIDLIPGAIVPIVGALIASSLIGLERELHGHPAGLRTHILVCLASTVLMISATRQGDWSLALIPGEQIVTDPTRMAHGVLTGIGFLCAGVIFREGLSIRGLTTAASLWMTSALGLLFGVGLWKLAALSGGMTLAVLLLLRIGLRYLPRRRRLDLLVRSRRESGLLTRTLEERLAPHRLKLACVGERLLDAGAVREHEMKVHARQDQAAETLAGLLLAMDDVVEFEIRAPTD